MYISEMHTGLILKKYQLINLYTEEEKVRILDKVFLYGVSSTAVFVFLLGMYAYGLQNRSEWLGDIFLFLINMGGFFSLSTAFAGLRLKGKMSKERAKKIARISLAVCAAALILVIGLIIFATTV